MSGTIESRVNNINVTGGGGGGGGSGTVTSVNTDSTTQNILQNSTNVIGTNVATISLLGQGQNLFLAAPSSGGSGTPSFRNIVASDVPQLNQNTTGSAASVTGAVSGSQISGNIPGNAANVTGTVPISNGGTGQATAAAALGALGGAPSASPSFTGTMTYGSAVLNPSIQSVTASSSTLTINFGVATSTALTLGSNVTLSFTNPQVGWAYVIEVIQGSGSYTVTWPTTVKWPGGTAPVITTTSGQVDLINLYWNGTSYRGSYTQNYAP